MDPENLAWGRRAAGRRPRRARASVVDSPPRRALVFRPAGLDRSEPVVDVPRVALLEAGDRAGSLRWKRGGSPRILRGERVHYDRARAQYQGDRIRQTLEDGSDLEPRPVRAAFSALNRR